MREKIDFYLLIVIYKVKPQNYKSDYLLNIMVEWKKGQIDLSKNDKKDTFFK